MITLVKSVLWFIEYCFLLVKIEMAKNEGTVAWEVADGCNRIKEAKEDLLFGDLAIHSKEGTEKKATVNVIIQLAKLGQQDGFVERYDPVILIAKKSSWYEFALGMGSDPMNVSQVEKMHDLKERRYSGRRNGSLYDDCGGLSFHWKHSRWKCRKVYCLKRMSGIKVD